MFISGCKTGNWSWRTGARYFDIMLLLKINDLDLAETTDVRMFFIEVLGKFFIFYFIVVNRR